MAQCVAWWCRLGASINTGTGGCQWSKKGLPLLFGAAFQMGCPGCSTEPALSCRLCPTTLLRLYSLPLGVYQGHVALLCSEPLW